jgi:hypothetical protein
MIIIFDLTIFLKLFSYAHTNYVIRQQYFNQKKSDQPSTAKPESTEQATVAGNLARAQKEAFERDLASYPSSVTFKSTLSFEFSYLASLVLIL